MNGLYAPNMRPGVSDGKEIPGYLARERAYRSTPPPTALWPSRSTSTIGVGKVCPSTYAPARPSRTKLTEVNIIFRRPPLMLFDTLAGANVPPSNMLTLRIQPDEGIRLSFDAKRPGPTVIIERVAMDFSYREQFGATPAPTPMNVSSSMPYSATQRSSSGVTRSRLAWERVGRMLDGWENRKRSYKEQDENPINCRNMLLVLGGQRRPTSSSPMMGDTGVIHVADCPLAPGSITCYLLSLTLKAIKESLCMNLSKIAVRPRIPTPITPGRIVELTSGGVGTPSTSPLSPTRPQTLG